MDELKEYAIYFGVIAQEQEWTRKGYDIDRAYRVYDEAEAELRDGAAAVDGAFAKAAEPKADAYVE